MTDKMTMWSEKPVKQLEKLNKKDARKIFDSVMECAQDPYDSVMKLRGSPPPFSGFE